MFGTNKKFQLDRVPFSTKGSFMCIFEGAEDKKLHLGYTSSSLNATAIANRLTLSFMDGETELDYTYECDPAKLTVTTEKGTAEFVFDGQDLLRIRVKGISVWVNYEPAAFEGCVMVDEEVLHMESGSFGKMDFASVIPGSMNQNSNYSWRNAASHEFRVACLPVCDGVGEIAVHSFFSNRDMQRKYRCFDIAHMNTKEDFRLFCLDLPCVDEKWGEMAEIARYVLWVSSLGPARSLEHSVFYMNRTALMRAYLWQQPLTAIAFSKDIETVWAYMKGIFDYQDEKGALPDTVNDARRFEWVTSRFPSIGFAICWALDNMCTKRLKYMDYDDMYHPLVKYANWWKNTRDFGSKGCPCYVTARDCGYHDSALFEDGLPARTPDLAAWTAMLYEACARLAKATRRHDAAEYWMAESKKVIDYLVNNLWNGEKFVVENALTGEKNRAASAIMYIPVILGERLPSDIQAKATADLLNGDTYMTACGIGSQCQKSPLNDLKATARGRVVSALQIPLLAGLKACGRESAVKVAAEKYLAAACEKGLGLALDPSGEVEQDKGIFSPDLPFCCVGAAAFLFAANQF